MRYQKQHLDWLREWRPKLTENRLTEAFNHQFDAYVSVRSLIATCCYYGILTPNNKKGYKSPLAKTISLAEHAKKLGIDGKTMIQIAKSQKLVPAEKTKTGGHLYFISELNAAYKAHLDSKAENQHWTTPAHTKRQAELCRLFRQVDQAITRAMSSAST